MRNTVKDYRDSEIYTMRRSRRICQIRREKISKDTLRHIQNVLLKIMRELMFSIHKAQGLGAKKRLKIYWSAETMDKIVKSFSVDETKQRSLEIVRSKLGI